MTNWHDTPILIPVRDRLSDLLKLLAWLDNAGYWNVNIIDNDTTYPPAVHWLRHTARRTIYPLARNVGSRSPWLPRFAWLREGYYVVTDPDIQPIFECPVNLVEHLAWLLEAHPDAPKAGIGLHIRDTPQFHDKYREQLFQNAAERWIGDCFRSPVETTFALYRPGSQFTFDAVRSAFPYEARHLPWYREDNPTEEDLYYLAHAKVAGLMPDGEATGGSDWAGWADVSRGTSNSA